MLGRCPASEIVILYSGKIRDLEADLAGGRVSCPACPGVLGRWGHARGRLVRWRAGAPPRWWRPRRGCCRSCGVTHVLVPADLLPRCRHGIEIVGAALLAYAGGAGHRSIAARAGLAPSTVRNWLRGFAGHVEVLRSIGTRRYYQLDVLAVPIDPAGTPAADALEALARAARATVLAHGAYDSPWPVINFLTGGELLRPGLATAI